MKQGQEYYTFIAEDAIKNQKTIRITCDCSNILTIDPPIQEQYIFCPNCESKINYIVLQGNPDYMPIQLPNGETTMVDVAGSGAPSFDSLSLEEKQKMTSDFLEQVDKNKGEQNND